MTTSPLKPSIPPSVIEASAWVDLQELDQHGEGLTQWEIDFVESLTQQLLAGRNLSDKQRTQLQRIREDRL